MRYVLMTAVVLASWYGMQLVHEFGHVAHAWLSGGTVARVRIPLIGFSQTQLSRNPHPQFVAWGGAIWGCLIPITIHAIARRAKPIVRASLCFFAGFCLIANGAYLAIGSLSRLADAGDLMRHGAPQAALLIFGLIAIPLGLIYWHQLGRHSARMHGEGSASGDSSYSGKS